MRTAVVFILALFIGAPLLAVSAPIVAPATHVLVRSGDPTAGNGVQAAVGQLYVDKGTSDLYVKTGTAATAWTAAGGGGGGGGSPSLAYAVASQAFSGSTICDVDLTVMDDWVGFIGGNGAWGVQGVNFNGSTSATHKRGHTRLFRSISFQGGDVFDTVAYADPNFTATDSSHNSSGSISFSQTGAWNGNIADQGVVVDLPLKANESGVLTLCVGQASATVRTTIALEDGSAAALIEDIANPSPGGGTRYQYRISVTFTNSDVAGNRLLVTSKMIAPFGPFTGEFGVSAIYLQ
jgi:hypothetical protein